MVSRLLVRLTPSHDACNNLLWNYRLRLSATKIVKASSDSVILTQSRLEQWAYEEYVYYITRLIRKYLSGFRFREITKPLSEFLIYIRSLSIISELVRVGGGFGVSLGGGADGDFCGVGVVDAGGIEGGFDFVCRFYRRGGPGFAERFAFGQLRVFW